MIRAQMTLKDGKTPGQMRQGAAAIEVCLAAGCKIYPNPLNRIPDEWTAHVVSTDADDGNLNLLAEKEGRTGQDAKVPEVNGAAQVRKRGRPRKTTA